MALNTTANTKKADSNKDTTSENTSKNGEAKVSLLEKLFINMLKDMYWAEKHLVEALETMQSEATTNELQEAFEDHKFQTQKHISRLEKVFKLMGKEPEAKKCEAMKGLVEEANSIIKETKKNTMTRDAGLIIAAQKVEHYEIASYGSLVQVAKTIGRDDAAKYLEKTLWEEEDTDQLLTQIAEYNINPSADDETNEENNATSSSAEQKEGNA